MSSTNEDRPEDIFRHCPHCQGRTKHVPNQPPPEICGHCGKSLLITVEPRIQDETHGLVANVPPHLIEGLRRFALEYRPVGRFLTSCLMGAVMRADEVSLAHLRGIMQYIYNAMPSLCHGSPEKVKAWLAKGESKCNTDR